MHSVLRATALVLVLGEMSTLAAPGKSRSTPMTSILSSSVSETPTAALSRNTTSVPRSLSTVALAPSAVALEQHALFDERNESQQQTPGELRPWEWDSLKSLEVFLYGMAWTCTLFAMYLGKWEAILMLLLLLSPRKMEASIMQHPSLTTITTDTPSVILCSGIMNTQLPSPLPTATASCEAQFQCHETVKGVDALSAYPVDAVWSTFQESLPSAAHPGPTYADGRMVAPCVNVEADGAAPSSTRTSTVAAAVAIAYAFRLLRGRRGIGAVALIAGLAALNTQTVTAAGTVSGVPGALNNISASIGSSLPSTTPAPTTLVLEIKGTVCYITFEGRSYPAQCPANIPPPPPQGTLPAGMCEANGLVYACPSESGSTYNAALRVAGTDKQVAIWSLQVAASQLTFVPRRALHVLWVVMAVAGVQAKRITDKTPTTFTTANSTTTIPSITAASTTLVPEIKGQQCYATANGLVVPTQCPGNLPSLPSGTLPAGTCEKNGLIYACGSQYYSSASKLANMGLTATVWYLPLAAHQVRLIARPALAAIWGLMALVAIEAKVARESSMVTIRGTHTEYVTVDRPFIKDTVQMPKPEGGAEAVANGMSAATGSRDGQPTTLRIARMAKEAFACFTTDALMGCSPGHSPPSQASSIPTPNIPFFQQIGTGTALIAGGILLVYALRARNARGLLPLLFVGQAVAAAGTTSIPLPQLAVNTTSFPSSTFTQTLFVSHTDPAITPTVTQYIALCTPYCASVNDNGQCVQVKGCTNIVSNDAAVIVRSRMSFLGIVLVFAAGGILLKWLR